MKVKLIGSSKKGFQVIDEDGNYIEGISYIDFRCDKDGTKLSLDIVNFNVDIEVDEPEIIFIKPQTDIEEELPF